MKSKVGTKRDNVVSEKLAVKSVIEAPWNTRGEITEASVKALAGSIASDGLLTPINVIRKDKGYVCFDGCRRLAACKSLGMKEIDATVWDITEDEAKVKTVTANIQREEDDPMLAARVIGGMLEGGHDANEIAAKLGKSVGWVNRRRKLIALADCAEGLVGKVTVDALERIAALPEELQKKVVKSVEIRVKYANGNRIDARDVNADIELESQDLDSAYFDTTPCKSCEKRTGVQADLFGLDDGKLGRCLDCKCFRKCVKAWEDAKIAEAGVGPDDEVVRVQCHWQMPDHAKGMKKTAKKPCAYVFVNRDEVTVKWGMSKKQEQEAKRKREEAEAEKNAEIEAENGRVRGIVDKLSDYINNNEDAIREKLAEEYIDADDKTASLLTEFIYYKLDEWHIGKDWAEIIDCMGWLAEKAGVSDEDKEWYLGKFLEGEED